MAGFVKVAKTGEIAPGQGKQVEVNAKKIALFNVEGSFYVIDDTINNDSYNHSTKRLQSYQFHAEKTLAVYEENCSQ
jgi:nitrite reductase/ring-hydroxylating ferredoxin subunit